MASYNRIIMVGNLTRDPEYKQLTSGQAVCRFGLASNRQFKNRQTGAQVQEVCFVDIDVWGAQADSCNQYLQKGRQVLVEGRLKFDNWEDADGNRRSKHSVVADRVTFLASAQQADDYNSNDGGFAKQSDDGFSQSADSVASSVGSAASVEPKNKKAAPKKSTATGEIDMNDKAPFEDELPF